MQYWTCPLCGANLDRNEKCDCAEERASRHDFFSRHLKASRAGQLAFVFGGGMAEADRTGRRERN